MPASAQYPAFSDANLRGAFFQSYEEAMTKRYIDDLIMKQDSDRAFEQYGWLGTAPVLRKWDGGRHLHTPNEFGYEIYNEEFEGTLVIPIKDINRDKTGQFQVLASGMGQRAAENPQRLFSTLLEAGESSPCFDDQYFFDTDHNEGGGVNNNDIQVDISGLPVTTHGIVSEPSDEEMEKAILKGIKQFFTFKDDQGEPVNENAREFKAVVPIAYLDSALAAVKNEKMTSGRQNTLVTATNFKVSVEVDPRLSWTDKFALFRTDHPVKPFIHQLETDTEFTFVNSPQNDHVFKKREYLWGVYRSEAVGYGDYKKACLVTLI